LSTLTKVLIVLLTTFSIFLCGIVVTYVANAENQRQKADNLQRRVGAAEKNKEAADADLTAAKDAFQKKEADLNGEIAKLKADITEISAKAETLKTEKAQAEQDKAEQISKAAVDAELAKNTTKLHMDDQDVIKKLEAERTDLKKDIEDLNVALMEKMTLLAQFEEKNRQLTEANQDISNRLNQELQRVGLRPAAPKVATPETGIAAPATALPVRDIALKGKVSAVDLQRNVAAISIGAASGVRTNMTFHVTRGTDYICDIVIQSTDPDRAVGQLTFLDRNRAEPQVGDAISTNL
jgi:hypothetical protein